MLWHQLAFVLTPQLLLPLLRQSYHIFEGSQAALSFSHCSTCLLQPASQLEIYFSLL